jgi:hypothetical protein
MNDKPSLRLKGDTAARVERERHTTEKALGWDVSTAAMVDKLVREALDAREATRKAKVAR